MNLKDRTAIVTGGATGIGRAIALKMAEQGARIVVADLNAEAAESTAGEIADAHRVKALAVTVDVTSAAATQAMADAALQSFSRIDILVNNAGVAGAPGWHTVPHSRDEDWIMTYEVNVKGAVNATNAIVPFMRGAKSGKIVNIASIAGRQGRPSLPHYSASKSAVINYTQSLANELAPFNINVNAICPGLLWTPMWDQVGSRYAQNNPAYKGLPSREVFERMIADNIPLGREQTPEDVGDLAAFLVSEDARNITGQAINVDGGFFLN